MTPITRRDAHAQGLRTYYTGRPCKHGHDSPRYVSTGGCKACLQQFSDSIPPDTMLLPATRVHVDDHAYLRDLIDKVNAMRRLPPVAAPEDYESGPTAWSEFLAPVKRYKPHLRSPLFEYLQNAMRKGIELTERDWRSMPEDTWSGAPSPGNSLADFQARLPAYTQWVEANKPKPIWQQVRDRASV